MREAPLARYAVQEAHSRGRRYPEARASYRGEFQRDRDRIVHSTAFRRLVYKTQVFVNHEGDLYRTRLTHSLEVSQIARTIAVALRLNESLVEAVCLAHDLGHTPFGHAGQDALNGCMRDYGGFEHNLQSLRVVDELEVKYADFPGLNLMFETREGILKHCSARNARALGPLGERFLTRQEPSLEAQLADVADAIAYNNHDVDDGIRAGLLTVEQLAEESLFKRQLDEVERTHPQLDGRRRVHEIIRRVIDYVVTDLLTATRKRLEAEAPQNSDDVRRCGRRLVGLSKRVNDEHLSLKRFLSRNLYRHDKVAEMTGRARHMVEVLFTRYMENVDEMPPEFSASIVDTGEAERARTVADYVAGMTDRFAIKEYDRLA